MMSTIILKSCSDQTKHHKIEHIRTIKHCHNINQYLNALDNNKSMDDYFI